MRYVRALALCALAMAGAFFSAAETEATAPPLFDVNYEDDYCVEAGFIGSSPYVCHYIDAQAAPGGDGSKVLPWDSPTDVTPAVQAAWTAGGDPHAIFLSRGDTWTDQPLELSFTGPAFCCGATYKTVVGATYGSGLLPKLVGTTDTGCGICITGDGYIVFALEAEGWFYGFENEPTVVPVSDSANYYAGNRAQHNYAGMRHNPGRTDISASFSGNHLLNNDVLDGAGTAGAFGILLNNGILNADNNYCEGQDVFSEAFGRDGACLEAYNLAGTDITILNMQRNIGKDNDAFLETGAAACGSCVQVVAENNFSYGSLDSQAGFVLRNISPRVPPSITEITRNTIDHTGDNADGFVCTDNVGSVSGNTCRNFTMQHNIWSVANGQSFFTSDCIGASGVSFNVFHGPFNAGVCSHAFTQTSDPQFCQTGDLPSTGCGMNTTNETHCLRSTSPAIDSGNPTFVPIFDSQDLDAINSTPRPQDGPDAGTTATQDRGADEWYPEGLCQTRIF